MDLPKSEPFGGKSRLNQTFILARVLTSMFHVYVGLCFLKGNILLHNSKYPFQNGSLWNSTFREDGPF